jgi:flavin reductase (DIM6/NTAB) family NADH-FMN oxidoreductase RutF
VLADHHETTCRQLAGAAEHRFDGVRTTVRDGGAVVLDDAVATFECTISQEIPAGDHTLVLLHLHAVDAPGLGLLPLVFHRSGFGRLDTGG